MEAIRVLSPQNRSLRFVLPILVAVVCLFSSTAWGSIAIDANVSKDNGTSSTTITSPTFNTTASNELILAFVASDYISGANVTVTQVTGGGLTWVLVKRTNTQSGTSEIWRAFATTPLTSASVTATLSQKVASSLTVLSFSGVDTTGTNGSGAIGATASGSASSGAPTATLTTTRNGSWVFGVGNDYDNAVARTPAAGQSLVHQNLSPVGDTYWVQMQNAATPLSGTSVKINDTAPTGDRYNLSIVEVLPDAGSGGTTTFTVSGSISPATSGAGTVVTLTQNATSVGTATADTNGNFAFSGIANGTYTVTPSKSGFNFSPSSQSITVNSANITGVAFAAAAQTFSVGGTITPAVAGISVGLTGAATANTTTDATGSFNFSGLANGSYVVTPSQSGTVFTPTSRNVTVNGANVTGVSFTSAPQTWAISGTISPAASGISVALGGTSTASTTTNASGAYSFTGLANGSYTVTPSQSGTTFSPNSINVTVNGANVTGQNFTATTPTFSISGSVTPAVAGVNMSLSGAGSGSVSTDATGAFTFSGLANGTYTITPALSGYSFNPASQSVTISNSNVSGVTFTDTTVVTPIHLIQTNVNGNESSVASISTTFATPNTAGNFLIVTGTAARPNGTLTISDSLGNTYSPAIGPVVDSVQDTTAYVWYVPSCKGGNNTVTITPTSARALEIHVSEWSGLATTSPVDQTSFATGTGTTASSGTVTPTQNGELIFGYTFLFNTATAGAGFTPMSLVNGDLDEYQIQTTAGPVAATFTQTSGTWFAVVATFKAAGGSLPGNSTISGTITPAVAGMGITLSGSANGTTSTDASGNYSFQGLSSGNYTVTPTQSGYTFTPPSTSVTVNGTNSVTGVNFSGQQVSSAPLSIDVKVSGDSSSSKNTIATPAFSTSSNNELLLAFVATDYASGANTTVTQVTGGGLTWNLVRRSNAQAGTAEVWRAFASTPLSNATVTATLSQSVASSITVMSFIGADTSGTNGSGAIGATNSFSASSGAPIGSVTTTRSGSWVLGVGNDFDKAVARTVGSNQTMVHQYLATVGDTYWVQMQNAPTPTSGTIVGINDTAPTADRYNLTVVEVLPATNVVVTTPPTVNMISPTANSTVSFRATVAANATDQVSVAGVQFLLDGNNLGTEVTSPPFSVTWDTSAATGTHTLSAIARNGAGLTTTAAPITVNVDNSGNPALVGSWSNPVTLPTVAVNLVLLPNNKLFFYEDGGTPTVWDYTTNSFTNIATNANLFCSGHAALADGRILIVGGYGGSGSTIGIANAEIFDPQKNTFTAVPNMNFKRWYPTATSLSDGRILVTAGWQTTQHTNAGIPEIYDPATNTWTELTTANNPFETYPFIYLLPDGRLIHVNGSEFATVTDVLDLTTNKWSTVDGRIIDGGSSSMYLPGKIMKAGSASDSQSVGPSSNTTFVLDTTQSSPAWQQTPSMAYPRSFLNLTTLPDGTVLATGGETDKNGGNVANAVYAAELWNPQTQTWTTMSSMHTPREYHSTALLLPDGRVVQSGMGADFGNVPDETSAEFFSPPYLFKGARPTISQAPSQLHYGTSFFVATPDATSITSAVLIRTGAVTHFFDQNTRFVPISFTQGTGGLNMALPSNPNLLPPGHYMLFVVNTNGVPSVAPIVQVGP